MRKKKLCLRKKVLDFATNVWTSLWSNIDLRNSITCKTESYFKLKCFNYFLSRGTTRMSIPWVHNFSKIRCNYLILILMSITWKFKFISSGPPYCRHDFHYLINYKDAWFDTHYSMIWMLSSRTRPQALTKHHLLEVASGRPLPLL